MTAQLLGHGVRPTAQRLQIALLVLDRPCHFSADQLLASLRKGGQRVSKATVYNTLNLFSRRGLIAEYGIAWILPRLIGLPKAIDLMFTSRKVAAGEALQIGLVNQVLPDEGFLPAVQKFAAELGASVSPRSLRVMKQQLYAAQSQTLDQAMDIAIEEMLASLQCDDFKEGVAHFLEKREPRFTGK